MRKILLVEDEAGLRKAVRMALSPPWDVVEAGTIAEGRARAEETDFDLILLDVNLPDGTGFKLCSQLRSAEKTRRVPILFLTGEADVSDKVMGFSLGADDYLVKPVHRDELKARVEARMRKADEEKKTEDTFTAGNVTFDLKLQRAVVATGEAREVQLTALEFRLLSHLARHPNRVFSREELIAAAWGPGVHVSDHAVDTHISKARAKIVGASHTVVCQRGFGYHWVTIKKNS